MRLRPGNAPTFQVVAIEGDERRVQQEAEAISTEKRGPIESKKTTG
jgi:hypothetical protein